MDIVTLELAKQFAGREIASYTQSFTNQLNDIVNLTSISTNHIFNTIGERDAYFVTNPSELIPNTFVSVGTSFYQYLNGQWVNKTSVIHGKINSAVDVPLIDSGNYFTIDNVNAALQQVGNDLKVLTSTIGIYGVKYNPVTDITVRTKNAFGKSVDDLKRVYPWSGMRRCNLSDSQVVNAYYGEPGYVEDGTNGQCMVEVPAFYYKRWVNIDGTIETEISATALNGYNRHPWFYNIDGSTKDRSYLSSYEGSIFDTSSNSYLLNDEQVADFTVTTGDKLSSIANAKPCSGLTQELNIINTRILSQNRGAKWQQQYYNAVSAIQMLFVVEYASINSQAALDNGVVSITDDLSTNMAIKTGYTSILGNESGKVSVIHYQTGQTTYAISYHGIENFWGNIWKWVDGVNIKDGFAYVSNVNGNFVSNIFTGQYVNVGELSHTNGYMSKALLTKSHNHGYLPQESLASSSTKYADYYYQNGVGAFVARLGGGWISGSNAGAFYWYLYYSSAYRNRNVGARLCT